MLIAVSGGVWPNPSVSQPAAAPYHADVRVLVVEDEAKMAALVRKALELEGYSVDTAATGTDAVWLGSENEYDAIVLDVMIPEPTSARGWPLGPDPAAHGA